MEAVAAFRAPFLRKDVARLAAYENRMKKIELGYVGQRYGGQDNEEGEAKSKNNKKMCDLGILLFVPALRATTIKIYAT